MGTRKKAALEQFNRDNILEAAKELFELKGVEATTMDDIAKHADYSKSTIYVYFKSKEDIYNSIVEDYLSILTGEIETCISADEGFEETYFRLCDCLVSFEEKYPKYYASLMGEENMTNSRKKTNIINQDVGRELRELISSLLEKGVRHNVLRKDIDLQPTVLYVWSAISGIIQVADRKKDTLKNKVNMDREEYLRYSFRTFYDSLVRR
ncbi:MAG: TetR/AcrR family transcriptional regulator [Lachnospiraceae bacterium]|nr:TetR/AcrR family transcriptional regulator [Lachnospiraceae bacterium]